MPKISEYQALTAAEINNADILPIVDVSATGVNNPGGTTKKIVLSELKTAVNPLGAVVVSGVPTAGQVLKATSGVAAGWAADSGSGAAITVQDEGTPLATDATVLNFTGAGVTASGAGGTKTINIPGGGSTTIANNLTTTVAGSALDAVQGKALKDTADALAGTVAAKQASLVSGTNIKTIKGASILAAGDVVINDLGAVVLSGTPTNGQVPIASSGSSAAWGTLPSATGVPGWTATTVYFVGQRAISPSGRLIVCRTAHTSPSTFNALNWNYVSNRDETVIDFTMLPDGPANTIEPVSGNIYSFGTPSGRWPEFEVSSGRFFPSQTVPNTGVTYLEIRLPSETDRVQHMWADFEVDAAPESGQGVTMVLANPGFPGGAAQAPIHWNYVNGTWFIGAYNLVPVSSGPTTYPPYSPLGRRLRLDITVDLATGRMQGFANGVLIVSYSDFDASNYIFNTAIFEIGGTLPNYPLREFGCSAHLPIWAIDGSAVPTISSGTDFSSVVALSSTWQIIHSFWVSYSETGAINVELTPLIDCTAGVVEMSLSTAAAAPTGFYVTRVAEATTKCRVPFMEQRTGIPGTTEQIAVWAKTTGTASIKDTTNGNRSMGARWYPAFNGFKGAA